MASAEGGMAVSWSMGRSGMPRGLPNRDGNPHAAARLGAVAGDLTLEVEGLRAGQAGGLSPHLVGDELGGQYPGDLELDPVGVTAVEGLGGDMVRCPHQS